MTMTPSTSDDIEGAVISPINHIAAAAASSSSSSSSAAATRSHSPEPPPTTITTGEVATTVGGGGSEATSSTIVTLSSSSAAASTASASAASASSLSSSSSSSSSYPSSSLSSSISHDAIAIDIGMNFLPPPSQSDWRHLPSDLLYLIALHLDARSLCRFGSTERACHIVANNSKLWCTIIERHGWNRIWLDRTILDARIKGSCEHLRMKEPRQFFMMRLELTKELRQQEKNSYQDKRDACMGHRRVYACRWYDEIIMPMLLLLLTILFFSLLAWQLDSNDDGGGGPGGHVNYLTFWSALSVCGLILLTTSCLCYTFWRGESTHSYRNHILPDEYYSENRGFIRQTMGAIGNVENGRSASRFLSQMSFLLMMLNFTLTLIFISLRVSGVVSWSWPVVFIPFYLFTALWCTGCHWIESGDDESAGASIYFVILLLIFATPIITFFILLIIYLNGSSTVTKLFYVLIPLFILDFILLTIQLLVTRSDEPRKFYKYLSMWILSFGAGVIFKILLGMKVDSGMDITYAQLFIPIYIGLGFLLIYACLRSKYWETSTEGLPKGRWKPRMQMPVESEMLLPI